LYTGAFRFPEGDAAASRVYGVAKLFEEAGCLVSFAGWETPGIRGAQYCYKNHDCHSQGEFRQRQLGPVSRLLGFLVRGAKTLRWLSLNRRFEIIVAYNPPALFSLALLLLAKLWRMHVVLDSTEWYEGEHLPGGRYGFAAVENWVRMRIVYPLFRNVICISRLLEEHFSGRNVVNIPPLMLDCVTTTSKPHLKEGVRFVYAGDAGKKDLLLPFIEALPHIHKTLGHPICLHIAGLEWDALRGLLEDQGLAPDRYHPFLECHGRLSRGEVRQLYEASHFSILFREDKRYARAGFPTKAMESWSNGCPIVGNCVGDFGSLAINMTDAILVAPDMAANVSDALQKIIAAGSYPQMVAASREKARALFFIDAHRSRFEAFLRRVRLGRCNRYEQHN
jgi:glycosyltransferase involved in cell wall biosynthesis